MSAIIFMGAMATVPHPCNAIIPHHSHTHSHSVIPHVPHAESKTCFSCMMMHNFPKPWGKSKVLCADKV